MARHLGFLQANVNHCAGAQDLLLQSMAEWNVDVAVVAEPYLVPTHPHWAADVDGSVAIIARSSAISSLTLRERGHGFVTAVWGEVALVGVYFSPNRNLASLEQFLDALAPAVRRLAPCQVIVAGDFNAKSTLWGNPVTEPKGREVEEWALATGLSLLNRGSEQTCVRQTGGSVVDLTFATPVIARSVENWRVEAGVETLSDHKYIRFEVSATPQSPVIPLTWRSRFPRWAISRLNRELADEAAIVGRWSLPPISEQGVDEAAGCLGDAFTAVCRAAMPSVWGRSRSRRAVYWWSTEIAELRVACNGARRAYTRSRRRRPQDVERDGRLYRVYLAKKKILQLAISRAKERAWSELLEGLSADPWGRPYKRARRKLCAQSAPLTESLHPALLRSGIGELFPRPPEDFTPPNMARQGLDPGYEEECAPPPITDGEMEAVIDRLRKKNRAPGPDGVHGKVLALALVHLGCNFRELLDRCLRSGQFPGVWKDGRLCLLQKQGRSPDSASAMRPIVLLNEAGKALERVIASRLVRHLEDGPGPRLSESQYGFRVRRSTIDALKHLRETTNVAESDGEVVLAVSLDIANAFNSLPHDVIREALKFFRVPLYLGRLLEAYLEDRVVRCEDRGGLMVQLNVVCGVPQGSVLGPILWDLGYDWVLRGRLLPGMSVICYADDTLVTSRGRNYVEAARLAEVGVALVVRRIERLGLRVRLEKTEALLFRGAGKRGPPPGARLQIGGVEVRVSAQMKYLGLTLDGGWTFGTHFRLLGPRVVRAAATLSRLLPNVGGPSSACRQLYSGICRSIATYGAPIWVNALTVRNKAQPRRAQRVIAVRVIRGYRTVSWVAATTLAGDPPWELVAEVLAEVYSHVAERRALGEEPTMDERRLVRRHGQEALMNRWAEDLALPRYGIRTVEAVRPVLARWMRRKRKPLTFRMTQILTGHGCFGGYLCRTARREPEPQCHDCGALEDSAQHVLEECQRWELQRLELAAVLGVMDLSLPSVVRSMLASDRSWAAMASFCETVMAQKETNERERESALDAIPLRRRRTGVRRRRFAHILPPP